MRVAAFVLAGGMSRRMGQDKAFLPRSGTTIIQHVAAQALEAAGNVAIVGRPDAYKSLGLPLLDEEFPGCGPLSGIETALRESDGGWALVLACDMPGVTAEWLRLLIARSEITTADAVVTARGQGAIEPLCALYHARLRADVRKALQEGRFAVRQLVSSWSLERVEPASRAIIENINTPEEWAAWSR